MKQRALEGNGCLLLIYNISTIHAIIDVACLPPETVGVREVVKMGR